MKGLAMSFTEPLGAPAGGDSFSAEHNVPEIHDVEANDTETLDDENSVTIAEETTTEADVEGESR